MKNFIKSLWKDESAQGATEYIMLLVVVVGLALLFKEKIQTQVRSLIDDLSAKLDVFKSS